MLLFHGELCITVIQGGARNVIPLILHITHFYCHKIMTSGTELILIDWKIVPNESL